MSPSKSEDVSVTIRGCLRRHLGMFAKASVHLLKTSAHASANIRVCFYKLPLSEGIRDTDIYFVLKSSSHHVNTP